MRPRMTWLRFGGALTALVVGAACGTSGSDDVFGGGTATSGAGGAGQGGQSSTSSGQSTSSGTTTSSSTSSGTTTSSTSSGQTSTSSSGTTTSSSSTSTTASSSSGGSDTTVFCKDAPCAAGEICCFHMNNGDLDHCGATGSCGPEFIELQCNSPDDCPNEGCCGAWNGQGYDGVACQPTCDGANIVMCFGDPATCDLGQGCHQSSYLGQGYMFCQ